MEGTQDKSSKIARDAEKVQQAHALVEQIGLKVRTACQRVGITPRTYYYHRNTRPFNKKNGVTPASATPQIANPEESTTANNGESIVADSSTSPEN